jgi:putative hydrolase of the HAD superfamily
VITNVIFDLGGVLVDWDPDKILRNYYPDPERRALLKAQLYLHPDWLELDGGTLAEAAALERLEQRVGGARAELQGLFEATRASLSAKPESVSLLESLHARGIGLFCISNMPASTYEYLRAQHDFFRLFRGAAISGRLKLMKPDARIFAHLLGRHELEAHRSAFVDDSLKNVEVARALGINGVHFRDAAQCAQELDALF